MSTTDGLLGRFGLGRRRGVRRGSGILDLVPSEAPVGADLDLGSRRASEPVAESRGLLTPRDWVSVTGEVSSVTVRPKSATQAYVVDLDTGHETVRLVFLGRRRVLGVAPGLRVRVTGRVSVAKGHKVIFNPAYDIVGGVSRA